MEQARHRTAAATRRAEVGRTILAVARLALRAAASVTLPLLALRALLRVREARASHLTDRQLADIGLTRADVASPHERPDPFVRDIHRREGRERPWERG